MNFQAAPVPPRKKEKFENCKINLIVNYELIAKLHSKTLPWKQQVLSLVQSSCWCMFNCDVHLHHGHVNRMIPWLQNGAIFTELKLMAGTVNKEHIEMGVENGGSLWFLLPLNFPL